MFVDDTASGVTENCVGKNKNVIQQLQEDEQLHASLLFSAGHRLASQKCLWYVVKYKRKGIGYTFVPKEDIEGELVIKEGFQYAPKAIKQLDANVEHKTLGHWIAPYRNNTQQKLEIKKTANLWSTRISTSRLSQGDKQVAYNAFLLPAIRYKLVSTNLSFEECDHLWRV